MTRVVAAIAFASALFGCASAPQYKKLQLDMPAAWKVEAPWRVSNPNDSVRRGPWWQQFGDVELDRLEDLALDRSPTLALAAARLIQARSALNAASAGLYPQVGINAREIRQRISANRPLTNYASPNLNTVQYDFAGSLTASYEIDFSGRVQSTIAGVAATAEQSAADFENARLLLTADLATAYFNLRALDIELDVLSRAIDLQRRSLGVATSRHDLGATSGLDVAQQQALLDSTLTQVDVLKRQRAIFEHAIATLTGTPAPLISIAARPSLPAAPVIPIGVPSDVLERRPDVASAERAMASANAQIGVANAAFYPSISLGAALGSDSRSLASLFNLPSMIWSLGASAAQTLFDGGRLNANLEGTRANYEATVATYRRIVLTAMQEVEDGIIGSAALERAQAQAAIATTSAQRVLDLATTRYEGGVATSLEVITAQQSLLTTERLSAQLLGQRLLASVFLVKALGGDWREMGQAATMVPASRS